MYVLRKGAMASIIRLPVSGCDAGRGRGAVGVLSLAGAVLALALLVGLSLTGAPAHAAFPGANGKIVCAGAITPRTPDDRDLEIYSLNPDGSGQTFLTNNGPLLDPDDPRSTIDEFDPVVSPDAQKIAFESTRTGASEVFAMNADGKGPATRLTTSQGEDRPGSFSPDGSKIVFHSTRDNDDFEVYTMDADGSNETRLTFRPGQDSNPSWSPDGTRIAFHSVREPGQPLNLEIYTMNPDGGDVRRVTNFPGIDGFPQWSPDGSKFVFRRDFGALVADSEIFTINVDGTDPRNLSNNSLDDPATTMGVNESFDDQGIWSPDGTRILFDSVRSGDREVYTMNASDGQNVQRLTNDAGFDGRCDWGRVAPAAPLPPAPQPPSGNAPQPPQTGTAARILPNLFRPRGSARQSGRKIVVRIRGRMGGNQGRSCAGRLKMGIRFAKSRRVTRTARMGANCRYAKRVAFAVRRLPRALRARSKPVILRVAVRFQGNGGLLTDVSPTRRMKVRR
jgi:TolB protein